MTPLETVFPDSARNTPTRKTGDAAFGRIAASSHHAPANLLTGRKVSELSAKVLKTDLTKYPFVSPEVCLNYTLVTSRFYVNISHFFKIKSLDLRHQPAFCWLTRRNKATEEQGSIVEKLF